MKTKKKKTISVVLINIVIVFSIIIFSIVLSTALFTSNPKINPGVINIYADQDLECRWTIDITTDVNVSWYVNGVLNRTYNRTCNANIECITEGNGIISKINTVKNQVWTCEVSYFNGTSIESKNDSVTIQDSVPTIPLFYYSNGTLITNDTIPEVKEDDTTIFIINSTDVDNDPITYSLQANTANCSINSITGYITCQPYNESHVGLKQLRFRSEDNNGATRGYVNYTINVTPNNDAPYFYPSLQNKQIYEGQGLNYIINGRDDENDVPFTFFIQSPISSLIIVQLNSTSALIRFNNSGSDIAQFSDRGNHTINVTITDSGSPSRSNTSSFNLEVIPTNHLPNISVYVVNSTTLIQGGELLILINATDIDNDTLTFTTNNPVLYNIVYGSTNKSDPNGTSFANATIYVPSLSNNHVIYNSVVVSVFDGKQNNTANIVLDITNINDAPVLHEISNNPANTLGNTNITNLTAYTGVLFVYYVNATDVDQLTYMGDTLYFASNDSNFNINSTTGKLSFVSTTPGAYIVRINVTDTGNLYDEIDAIINVYPNNNPYFNSTLNFECEEYDANNYPFNCTINISYYAKEDDIGDSIVNYWTNSSFFSINNTTGIINFLANQSLIGNYSILVNITDSRGGFNSTVMNLSIINTNNKPTILDIVQPEGKLIVGNSYNFGIYANDSDLYLIDSYENLTFTINVTGPNSSIFQIEKTSSTTATITVNPLTSEHAGNYTVNVTVTDFYGNYSRSFFNFFIYNITLPPNITQITPFGAPLTNTVNTSWINVSSLNNNSTTITILENTTYIFNHTTTYDTQYQNSISYKWYQNNTLISTAYFLSRYFNFFSSGTYNITLIVTDEFNKSASFTWIVNVVNVNRPPILITPLTNLTGVNAVNGTTTYSNYLTYYNSEVKFYDPDDDINENNIVEDTESTMTFSATNCDYASFTFINNSLKVQSKSIGYCLVNFTAFDSLNSSLNVTSYNVLVNVTYVSNETIPREVPTTTRGGGGGSSRTITIPIPEEVEKPKPLEIITPKLVTIYKNATVTVPIVLNNTWNDTIEGITLSAETNASNVTISLDRTYFQRMFKQQTEEVTLTISNYKSEGHYEIQVRAKVVNPDFTDTATIYVNSADTTSEGEQLETKISFARDLLSSNPECQELTELLNQAKKELALNNYEGTAKLVDSVINGCKYLVSVNAQTEKPSRQTFKRFVWKSSYNEYAIISGFAILFLISLYYIIKKDKEM